MTTQPAIKIEFKKDKIVEAVLLLSEIHVNKDALLNMSQKQVAELAFDVIKQTATEIIKSLMDEDLYPKIIKKFIKESNLQYLEDSDNKS